MRNWFKKTQQPKLTKSIANKSLSLESMEERIVPAVFIFADPTIAHNGGSVLHIVGSGLVDIVTLSLSADGNTLTVTDPSLLGTGTGTPFGGTNDGATYTLNFTPAIADTFAGIRVELLGSSDILNIAGGLDLRNITTNKLATNTMQLEFYGFSRNVDEANNTLAFLGNGGVDLTTASKNDCIIYKNWQTIDNQDTASKNAISIASVIPSSAFNYFKVADYDTTTHASRIINITSTGGNGPITFQVDSPSSPITPSLLQFDTQLELNTDLRIGHRQSSEVVNISSNASLYDPLFFDPNDAPQISFSSKGVIVGDLYIQTQGSVDLRGIQLLNSDLIVSDTGDFTDTGDVSENIFDFASA